MAVDTWLIRAKNQDFLLSGAYGATLAHADFGPTPTGSFGTNFRRFQGTDTTQISYFQVINPNTGSLPLLPCRNPNYLEIVSDTLNQIGTVAVTGSTSGATAKLIFKDPFVDGTNRSEIDTLVNSEYVTGVTYILHPEISGSTLVGNFLSGESLSSTDSIINGKKIPNSAWGGAELFYGRKIILQCLVRTNGVFFFGFGFWNRFDRNIGGSFSDGWPTLSPPTSNIGYNLASTSNPAIGLRSSSSSSDVFAVINTSFNTYPGAATGSARADAGSFSQWKRIRVVLNEKQQYYAETGDRISYTNSVYVGDSSDTPTWTLLDSYTSIPPQSPGQYPRDYFSPGFCVHLGNSTSYLDIDQIEVLVEDTDIGITTWT